MSFLGGIFDSPKDITTSNTSSTSQSVSTGTAGPEPWMRDEGRASFKRAKKRIPKYFKPYKGQRVAGYGAGYDLGKSKLSEMSALSDRNYGDTRGKLDQLWGANAGAMGKTAADYMSPYIDAVLQPQLRGIDEDRRRMGLEDDRAATMAGAFGDPQAGIRKAVTNSKFNTMRSDATGKAYSDGWDRGQTQHNTEMARLMSMPGMYQSLDQGKFDQDAQVTKGWTNFGVADQALQQKRYDVKYDDWLKKQGWGVNREQTILQLLGQVPHNKSTAGAQQATGSGTGQNIAPGSNDIWQLLGKVGGSALGGGFGEKMGDWLFG